MRYIYRRHAITLSSERRPVTSTVLPSLSSLGAVHQSSLIFNFAIDKKMTPFKNRPKLHIFSIISKKKYKKFGFFTQYLQKPYVPQHFGAFYLNIITTFVNPKHTKKEL